MLFVTGDLALITDGERRYSQVVFELCSEGIRTGQRGRPPKILPKSIQVRVKNTGSHAHKRGRKRPKYQAPYREHPQTSSVIENAPIHAKGSNCDRVKYSLKAWVEAWGCDQRRNAATSDSPRRVTPTRLGLGIPRLTNQGVRNA